MAVSTKVSGKIIKWKDKACLSGLMAESTSASTSTIRKRAWEHSTGKKVKVSNHEL